jgi:hypothetical protein
VNVSYCDLCFAPLKDDNCYMLYIAEPKNLNYNEMNECYDYIKKVRGGVKEICPTCKHIFDKMFELRLQRLSELTEEINEIYNLTSLKNPKERKNGKKEK